MDDHLLRFRRDLLYAFIDVETLNLNLCFGLNYPWQVGMLLVRGDEILEKHDMLVKWKTDIRISKGAAEKTHYSQEKVDSLGRPPAEVFPIMERTLAKADRVIGHNILGFDLPLLSGWYKANRRDIGPVVSKSLDTHLLIKALKMGRPYRQTEDILSHQFQMLYTIAKGVKTNLAAVSREANIEFNEEELHDACKDLELNLKVFSYYKYLIEI